MATLSGDEAKSERETTLRWDGHKDIVSIFTASPAIDRKLRRSGYTPSRVSLIKGVECGWFYRIPYADLRWTARVRKPLNSDSVLRRRTALSKARAQRSDGGPGHERTAP